MLIHWLKMTPSAGVRPVPEDRPGPRPAPWRRLDQTSGDLPPRLARLVSRFGDAVTPLLPVFRADETAWVTAKAILEVCRFLRDEEAMEQLSDLCGVHTPDRDHAYEVVIHLHSLSLNERVRLKVGLAPGEEMPSLTGLWPGANWLEREAFDLVGIPFSGHPDLRRILLPDDFDGHPLHKDFPLKG
ncbi:MAG: NADH-quinone oxidoreductase subunit C [Acidobacteriota bacterium]